jgi:hypothetical protein
MGYNRGDTYEEHIYEISKNQGIIPPGSSRAGAAANAPDLLFRHLGNDYKLEIKHNITNPDYGQRRVHFYPQTRSWKWALNDELSEYYDELNLTDNIPSDLYPIWYQKRTMKSGDSMYTANGNTEYTEADLKTDQGNFKFNHIQIPRDVLFKYYAVRDTHYIQVDGSGLYHLDKDVAQIGTPQFDGNPHFRFRVKRQSSKVAAHKCQFLGVIKLIKKNNPSPSHLNLDTDALLEGQIFPKIIS